jgi:chaperonin GroES
MGPPIRAPNSKKENKQTMKLQPLHDRLIVEAAAKEERTAGGIILPDTAQEKPAKGTVLAVGPGKTLDNGKKAPVDVKVGDVVLYGKYSGTEVTVNGEDFVILRADDVLAVVEGETTKKAAKKELAGSKK